MSKIPLNPQNKQSTLETFENDLNIPKLSQNTLDFLEFKGILVGFTLFYTFQRILWYFAHFCNIEVYILIILDFLGILTVYEVRFDHSIYLFMGYFGHFGGFWVILVVLVLLRLFWTIKWFWGYFVFGHFVVLVISGI